MSQKHKIIALGDQGVGKTSFYNRLIFHSFDEQVNSTVGIDFIGKSEQVGDVNCKLQLWDTSGQERFIPLIPSYLKDSNLVVCMFSTNNKKSFDNLEVWMEYVEKYSKGLRIVVVGNKVDLGMDGVDQQRIDQLKSRFNIQQYYLVSAKTGHNLDTLYSDILQLLVNNIYQNQQYEQAQTQKQQEQKHKEQQEQQEQQTGVSVVEYINESKKQQQEMDRLIQKQRDEINQKIKDQQQQITKYQQKMDQYQQQVNQQIQQQKNEMQQIIQNQQNQIKIQYEKICNYQNQIKKLVQTQQNEIESSAKQDQENNENDKTQQQNTSNSDDNQTEENKAAKQNNIDQVNKLKDCGNMIIADDLDDLSGLKRQIAQYKMKNKQYQIRIDFQMNCSSIEQKTKLMDLINQLKLDDRVGQIHIGINSGNEWNQEILETITNRYRNIYYIWVYDDSDQVDSQAH